MRQAAVIAALVAGGLLVARSILRSGRPGRYFSWSELTTTATGIDNEPPPDARMRIQRLVDMVLDPLRTYLGKPVLVTSGYRSPAVNAAIGGAVGSQHMKGEAADLVVNGMTSAQLAIAVRASGVPFDQLVYYGWAPHIHVSHSYSGNQRSQTLYSPARGSYTAVPPEAA